MTSPLYPQLRATAALLLTDKGQSMVLVKRAAGAYDPATGSASVTETPHPVTGAVFTYAAKDVDGTQIQAADRRVLVSAMGMTVGITTADTLTIGGVVHQVIEAIGVAPAGYVVLWKVQARA